MREVKGPCDHIESFQYTARQPAHHAIPWLASRLAHTQRKLFAGIGDAQSRKQEIVTRCFSAGKPSISSCRWRGLLHATHVHPAAGRQGLEASMHGALLGKMREGMQRASQYARDSFILPPRQFKNGGTGGNPLSTL